MLADILRGAADKAAEAGIAIVGGHTIKTDEPIFGLAVVGTVHPKKVLTNAGAKPGDALVLTKPIGLGIITTAAKNGEDKLGAIADAIRVMTTLNRAAAEVLAGFDVHALTDVTGFGLLGHLRNITAASGVTARVFAGSVPVLPAAREYVKAGIAPGGTHANWKFLGRLGDVRPGAVEGGAAAAVRRADVGRIAGERPGSGCGATGGGAAGRGSARCDCNWKDRGHWKGPDHGGKEVSHE